MIKLERKTDIKIPPKTEIELLKEENIKLKDRLQVMEQITTETSLTQQQLIELLIDMEVL